MGLSDDVSLPPAKESIPGSVQDGTRLNKMPMLNLNKKKETSLPKAVQPEEKKWVEPTDSKKSPDFSNEILSKKEIKITDDGRDSSMPSLGKSTPLAV